MATSERFDRFLDNISLTAFQNQDARTKFEGVSKKLHDHFYATEYNGSTRLVVGSYAKRTTIRPARDVDVYFKLPWSEFNESSPTYNVQSSLLQRIKAVLQTKYTNTDIRGDNQVVVVNFSNAHYVEVVPCFEDSFPATAGQFFIPNTTNGGSWRKADPRAEIKDIEESDRQTAGNTRKLIKMLKRWQEYCNVPIRTLVLELRVINFLKCYEHAAKSSIFYDWMVRDFFLELLKYENGHCKMPGLTEIIYYGGHWKSKAESALARAIKACEYEAQGNELNATLEWKKIFGDDYHF